MNKFTARVVSALLAVFMLFSLAACGGAGGTEDLETQIAALKEENNALKAQIDALSSQLEQAQSELGQPALPISTYANLVVEEWSATDTQLKLDSGIAQIQLSGEDLGDAVASAELTLWQDGTKLQSVALALPGGNTTGKYDIPISNVTFDMPKLTESDELELHLDVALDGGASATSLGGSWFYSDGQLMLAVG